VDPRLKINVFDIWGVTPDNYDDLLLDSLLDGQLPDGYSMKERGPLQSLSEVNSGSLKPFDGVLMFMPWNVMEHKDLMNKIHQCFVNVTKKGYNPIIVVTHIDQADDNLRKNAVNEIARLFKISENRIHLVYNYLKENSKNFEIDKQNMIILDEIMRIAYSKPVEPPSSFPVKTAVFVVVFSVLFMIGRQKEAAAKEKLEAEKKKKEQKKAERKKAEQKKAEEQKVEEEKKKEEEKAQQKKESDEKSNDESIDPGTDKETGTPSTEEESEKKKAEVDPNYKIVQVKVVSGASRQFKIGKNTTIRSLLDQAIKIFAPNDEKPEDHYLADAKGATYVETDIAWNGSVFYMNKHTSA